MSAQEETVSTTDTQSSTPPGDGAAPDKGAATDANGQAATRDANGRFRNPVQPRIDELTRKAHDAEREASYWRTRAENAEKPKEPEVKAEKPTADKFDNYGEFVEALADWKADQKVDAKLSERDQRDAEKRTEERRSSTWAERTSEARARIADFDEVMQAGASSVRVTDAVREALAESERGPEIAYQLVKDPSIADKLNGKSPQRAAIEVGRMEARLPAVSAEPDPEEASTAEETPKPTPAPVKKQTSAPAPVRPISRTASTTKDLSKLSMDDYVKERASQGAKWARRG